jgi:DNA replication protein DnaC
VKWCDKCGNSGRIGNDSVITYCDCAYGIKLKSANYKLLFQKAGLPINLVKLKLEDFYIEKNHKSGEVLPQPQVNMKKYAKKTVVAYEKQIINSLRRKDIYLPKQDGTKYNGNNLFFYGGEDSGKTMLAVHILKSAVYKTQTKLAAYYTVWDDLLSELIPFNSDWEERVERCKQCGLLCIDSIANTGISYDSYGHVHARLNMILKNRLLENKPIILTSNYAPKVFLQETGNIFNSLIKRSLHVKLDNYYHTKFDDGGY